MCFQDSIVLFDSVVVIPTFFLTCYPLGFQTLYKCGTSEASITKLQQIFAYFALSHFLTHFRAATRITIAVLQDFTIFIAFLCLLVTYTLMGQLSFIKYKYQLCSSYIVYLTNTRVINIHNALDALLFTNIAIINELLIFVHTTHSQPVYWTSVSVASGFQTFLTGLPLILLLLYTVVKTGERESTM